jgi:hypothetical protein
LVGPDGMAFINIVREAHRKFGPIRDEFKERLNKDVYLPPVSDHTGDIVMRERAKVKPV